MNGLPYYKAYPRDFFEGTLGMPLELKGVYRLVLDMIYMQGGALEDDQRYIAGLLGCSVRTWTTARAKLIEAGKLTVIDGLLRNYRADKERIKLGSFQTKQQEKAFARWENKDLADATAVPPRENTEPEPDKKEETLFSVSKKADEDQKVENPPSVRAKSPRGSRLPPDWQPSAADREYARAKGFTEARIDRMLEDFLSYWPNIAGQKGIKLNWSLTWKERVRYVQDHGMYLPSDKGRPVYGQPSQVTDLASVKRRIASLASFRSVKGGGDDDRDSHQADPDAGF